MSGKRCRGLDLSKQTIIEDDYPGVDTVHYIRDWKHNGEILESDEEWIEAYRYWYDENNYDKKFCVQCTYLEYDDEEGDPQTANSCKMYKTYGLKKAEDLEIGDIKVKFSAYAFKGADYLTLTGGAMALTAGL